MKIVMLSNFLNHHQVHLADEIYRTKDVEYHFIETMRLPDERLNLGYADFSDRPYVIKSYKSNSLYQKAMNLINEADIVVAGSSPTNMIADRLKKNKLVLRYSERFFKKRPWFFPDPRIWWSMFKNHTYYRNKNVYMLAASAFTANDVKHFFAYPNKCFKWGYFTKTQDLLDMKPRTHTTPSNAIHLMWCGRFLSWKHPELPVRLACKLKDDGYDFVLDMYGIGEKFEKTKELAIKLKVDKDVKFCGSLPNERILEEMRKHDIFLFTSDQNEGWGAVLNEAMSNGCAVVVSDMIGAAPFLIEDGKNGLLFKSKSLDSLYLKVKKLIDDKDLRFTVGINAVHTMQNLWSPKVAATRILHLSERLLEGLDTDYKNGPCSKAYPI